MKKGIDRVEETLENHTKLREAYVLKSKLDEWFKTSNHNDTKVGLEAWIQLTEEISMAIQVHCPFEFRNNEPACT